MTTEPKVINIGTPLSPEKLAQAKEFQELVLMLADGKSAIVCINALVNALADIYADCMVNGGYEKEKVLEHISKAIDEKLQAYSDLSTTH